MDGKCIRNDWGENPGIDAMESGGREPAGISITLPLLTASSPYSRRPGKQKRQSHRLCLLQYINRLWLFHFFADTGKPQESHAEQQ